MQQVISQISTRTVLEYAVAADAITDKILIAACVTFMSEPEHRQESARTSRAFSSVSL